MLYSDYTNAKDKYNRIKEWHDEHGRYPWNGGKDITPEELDELRDKMVMEEMEVPVASQVKEKFGGLRFYVDGANKEHHNFIWFAENMSYRTCEECGAPGKLYTGGWHRTLCKTHAEEMGYYDEKVEE
jgi:hypothetical protein